jgi:small subunit ribosomal protein S16
MVVKIRLIRCGRIRKPFYRIAVSNATSPRDGKFLDLLGHYNPLLLDEQVEASDSKQKFVMNFEKLAYWLKVGAQPTDRIKLFISKSDDQLIANFTEKYKKELEKRQAIIAAQPKKEKKKKK